MTGYPMTIYKTSLKSIAHARDLRARYTLLESGDRAVLLSNYIVDDASRELTVSHGSKRDMKNIYASRIAQREKTNYRIDDSSMIAVSDDSELLKRIGGIYFASKIGHEPINFLIPTFDLSMIKPKPGCPVFERGDDGVWVKVPVSLDELKSSDLPPPAPVSRETEIARQIAKNPNWGLF